MRTSVILGLYSLRILMVIALAVPVSTNASILSIVTSLFASETSSIEDDTSNSQKMPLLEAPVNADVNAGSSVSKLAVASHDGDESPVPAASPVSAQALSDEHAGAPSNEITIYKVKQGDTISGIAEQFGISVNTILWANDLTKASKIRIGQSLVILPITGVQHKVVSGDTLLSIAAKHKADIDEILAFNNLDKSDKIKIGDIIIVPDGEIASTPQPKPSVSSAAKIARVIAGVGLARADEGYYVRPIKAGVRTQGIHGDNAVDLADSCGTPIYASATGDVIIAKANNGWNGGYGNYVVISHSNGSQTLYAHMRSVSVDIGTRVAQGQPIGTIGATGKVQGATGCHVHFEIRGGPRNPF